MAGRPRLLLLDFDGVLAHYDRDTRVGELARPLGETPARVHEVMFGPNGLEHACDRGELDLPGYLAALRRDHGWAIEVERFVEARRAATRSDDAMGALLDDLRGQLELAVFTNNGAWFGEHLATICPPWSALSGPRFVCAGSLRAAKPEAAAFDLCLRRLGFEPGQVLFVDDNADNVDGARAAGLDALHFTDAALLRHHLADLGFSLGELHAT